MIAGGEVDGSQSELTEVVELVKTNSTPSFGQLPSARWGDVGAMFGNAPILCGGYDGSSYLDSCISFQNSQWSQSHSMNEKRESAAGVQINSTTFWILGGHTGTSYPDTTEFIIEGQTNGVPGPKLPDEDDGSVGQPGEESKVGNTSQGNGGSQTQSRGGVRGGPDRLRPAPHGRGR